MDYLYSSVCFYNLLFIKKRANKRSNVWFLAATNFGFAFVNSPRWLSLSHTFGHSFSWRKEPFKWQWVKQLFDFYDLNWSVTKGSAQVAIETFSPAMTFFFCLVTFFPDYGKSSARKIHSHIPTGISYRIVLIVLPDFGSSNWTKRASLSQSKWVKKRPQEG